MTQTLSDVRALVYDLYPTAIDQLGLEEALKTELKAFESLKLEIELTTTGNLSNLPAAIEVATYRIVMEAINNYSQARPSKQSHCEARANNKTA